MQAFDIIFYLIYNIVRVFALCGLIGVFLKGRKNKAYLPLIAEIMFFAATSLAYIFLDIPIVTLAVNVIFLLVYAFLLEGKVLTKLFAVIAVYSLAMISEGFGYLYTIKAFGSFNSQALFSNSILSDAFLLIAYGLLKNIINKNAVRIIKPKHTVILFLFPLFSLYLAYPFLTSVNTSIFNLLAVLILILLNCLVFYVFNEINKASLELYNKYVTENENKYYKNQLEIIKQSDERINKIKHDYKNHLIVLKEYFKNNSAQGINYIDRLLGDLSADARVSNCGNIVIDSLLNYKLKGYEESNIKLTLKVAVPKKLFVDDAHLNIILGNLLDNALTALQTSSEKTLNIVIKYIDKALFIQINNSYEGKVNLRNNKYLTSKSDNKNHGYGLINVKQVVGGYNGKIYLNFEDNIFSADIVLYDAKA